MNLLSRLYIKTGHAIKMQNFIFNTSKFIFNPLVFMLSTLGTIYAQESSDQRMFLEYKSCSIGVQNGENVMVFEISSNENIIKYVVRSGKRGEEGLVREGVLEEKFVDNKAPDGGRVMDVDASHIKIVGENLKVEWSESSSQGGWLYFPKEYKVFIYAKGTVDVSNAFMKGVR